MSYSTIKFGDNLIKNKACTITYSGTLFQNNSEFVNIVYGFGNEWHHTKEQEMERTDDGFVVQVNMLDYDTFNFCFRNSNYEWDNNNNQNYTSPITEEVVEEVNFIINDDTVIENIMTNLCEIDVSAASDEKVVQTAATLENVETASVATEGTPFDIEIETTSQCWKNSMTAGCFLTTCYPTSVTGTDGDNGNKSVKEDVVLSRKG